MTRPPLRRLPLAVAVTALALSALATGCATIIDDGPDMVPVESTPEGARVSLDGVPVGVTPCTVAVDRKGEGIFAFELAGHKTAVLDREKVLHGWIFGNLVFG